jgi:hypothetical protein
MSGGYLVYELLAAQAGVLLVAVVAAGLSTLLVGRWRPGSPRRPRLDAVSTLAGVVERMALPLAPPRQADPDARGARRPRAPDARGAAAA